MTRPSTQGWVKPKHSCMDEYNDGSFSCEKHTGSVWRCSCGKAWRIFGIAAWRLRRFDAPAHSDKSANPSYPLVPVDNFPDGNDPTGQVPS